MSASRQTWIDNETGNILVLTLIIIFAVSVIGATIAMISSMDLKISGNQRLTTEAIDVAEAGLSEAMHRLSLANPTPATIGGWTGNVSISDSRPYDPSWEARIYLTDPGSAPASGGSVYSTGTIQDPNGDYLPYSRSSGTEGVLSIRHKWVDRDGDSNRDPDEIVLYDASMVPPENFVSGFPVEVVTVPGRRANASRTIEAEVTKRTVIARTLGALYTDAAVQIGGTPSFCGYNHDVDTPVNTMPLGCFGFHLGSGGLPGITSTGDDVDITSPSVDIYGEPQPVDSATTNPWYSIAEALGLTDNEMSQILANADHTTPDANPLDGITFINGDAKLNSNTVGSGLIYIKGNATINGGFVFRGMIYVEGDLTFVGQAWILGTVMTKGDVDYGFSAGTATVLYSEDAIRNYIGQAMPAILLSWKEI